MNTIYLIGLLSPIFYAFTYLAEDSFVNKYFKNIASIIFFRNIVNFLFTPLFLFFAPLELLTIESFLCAVCISLIDVTYMFPYYKSFKHTEPSIISSMFAITKILIPIFAFLFLGETLNIYQYIGFFIIIFSIFALSYNPKSKIKINRGLYYMLLASLLITLENLLFKKSLETTNWISIIFWTHLFSSIFVLGFLLNKENKKAIKKTMVGFKKFYKVFLGKEFFEILGDSSFVIASSLMPITIAVGMDATEPIFVIFLIWMLKKLKLYNGSEVMEKKHIIKKLICYLLIITGATLTLI